MTAQDLNQYLRARDSQIPPQPEPARDDIRRLKSGAHPHWSRVAELILDSWLIQS